MTFRLSPAVKHCRDGGSVLDNDIRPARGLTAPLHEAFNRSAAKERYVVKFKSHSCSGASHSPARVSKEKQLFYSNSATSGVESVSWNDTERGKANLQRREVCTLRTMSTNVSPAVILMSHSHPKSQTTSHKLMFMLCLSAFLLPFLFGFWSFSSRGNFCTLPVQPKTGDGDEFLGDSEVQVQVQK
ncbi:two-component system, OmpR family, sensor kinase [Anopheles sinensis]|uniref:Two-component system, OmpR family, sensor kinase n=1 Tax=Anopheles sinensis TaxID=74873 RepID=A0A084W1S6_ANOSI|nr:two-component system, OmpR family, sensor kinase [Anopheles sinensis]